MSETSAERTFLTTHGARDWAAAAALGRRQHGVVSLSQLIACGFTASSVRGLVAAQRLHRIHRGVYALGPAALTPHGNRMAAVLACGPGSLLAARSCAAHRGLIRNSSSLIDVMCLRRVRRKGIRAHRLPDLGPADRTIHEGIPCTSIARTLLDLAVVRPDELTGALEQAEALGEFDLRALTDVIERNPGGPGTRRLADALVAMSLDGPRFRSEFEKRFRPICRAAGLPEPLINQVIKLADGPVEADYHWPALRLVVECDGYEFHRSRRDFREDRRRDRRLAAIGIHCLRYVWEDLDDPVRIERELRQVCRFRQWSSRSSAAG